ncbi:class I adenylate-forming enzyme family protein [Kitasatospora sp. NPDC093558]|uniref:class I adenylate-forming enzyme family protein n=1 Tax=Kitasatospora sp. NPDC093558 TaxID=3155201 RepID=UPI00344A0898
MPELADFQEIEVPGPSAPLGVLPEVAAERHGDMRFLSDVPWTTYGGPVTTVADFATAVRDYADRLWAAGVRRSDVVAVVQRNHIEVEAVMCALGRIGALPVLLSSAMETGELLDCLARLDRPKLLVDAYGQARLGQSRHALALLTTTVLSFAEPGTGADWTVPAHDRAPHVANPRAEDEWFVVTHSSGTTGSPKLAAHSTRSLFGMVAPMIMLLRTQYNGGDLNAKHLSFVHARTCAGTLASLEANVPMLAIADPRLDNVKRLLLEHRPTSLETHPNVFIQWESLAADPDRPLGPVQRFISTFDAIHPRTVRRLVAGSDEPGVHYLQAYGQTESGPICLQMVAGAAIADYSPRNVGFPGPGIGLRIVDEHGTALPDGTVGHIETLSPGRMRGYVGGAAPVADDAWWPMGDLGRLLPDGSLELLDRIVEHVDGTESLLEKEDELLERLPELVELVLVKAEDEGVFAVACPRAGHRGDEERFHAAAEEAGLGRIPVRFWEWEALPVTGSYKVRRGVLRERLAARVTAIGDPAVLEGSK